MFSFNVQIQDYANAAINLLLSRLKNRTKLNEVIGIRVKNLVRNYVLNDDSSRHTTSSGLGAPSSNFVTKAAQAVEDATPQVDGAGVTVLLPHPWFARAFGDVTIEPKSGMYLTIPIIAGAYNQRAVGVDNLFFIKGRNSNFLAKSIKNAQGKNSLELWYLLLTSVFQPQDRTRLPDSTAIIQTALDATKFYLDQLLAAAQAKRAEGNAS